MSLGWRALGVALVVCAAGCSDPGNDDACEVLEGQACPECLDGVVRCTFEDVEATEPSCGGCQARVGVYRELCDQGSTATRDEIEAGMVCEPAED